MANCSWHFRRQMSQFVQCRFHEHYKDPQRKKILAQKYMYEVTVESLKLLSSGSPSVSSFFEEGLETDGSGKIAELKVTVCLISELKNQLQFLTAISVKMLLPQITFIFVFLCGGLFIASHGTQKVDHAA